MPSVRAVRSGSTRAKSLPLVAQRLDAGPVGVAPGLVHDRGSTGVSHDPQVARGALLLHGMNGRAGH